MCVEYLFDKSVTISATLHFDEHELVTDVVSPKSLLMRPLCTEDGLF